MVVIQHQRHLAVTGLSGQPSISAVTSPSNDGGGGGPSSGPPLGDARAYPVQRSNGMAPEAGRVIVTRIQRQPGRGPLAASYPAGQQGCLARPGGAQTKTRPRPRPSSSRSARRDRGTKPGRGPGTFSLVASSTSRSAAEPPIRPPRAAQTPLTRTLTASSDPSCRCWKDTCWQPTGRRGEATCPGHRVPRPSAFPGIPPWTTQEQARTHDGTSMLSVGQLRPAPPTSPAQPATGQGNVCQVRQVAARDRGHAGQCAGTAGPAAAQRGNGPRARRHGPPRNSPGIHAVPSAAATEAPIQPPLPGPGRTRAGRHLRATCRPRKIPPHAHLRVTARRGALAALPGEEDAQACRRNSNDCSRSPAPRSVRVGGEVGYGRGRVRADGAARLPGNETPAAAGRPRCGPLMAYLAALVVLAGVRSTSTGRLAGPGGLPGGASTRPARTGPDQRDRLGSAGGRGGRGVGLTRPWARRPRPWSYWHRSGSARWSRSHTACKGWSHQGP